MKPIVIEPSSSEWAKEFERMKEYLWPHISDIAIDVIHIGSTSVPGLAAKPILDFNIVIPSYEVFAQLVERLRKLGYEHDGDGGLPTRERFIGGKRDGFLDYNMYVSPIESRILLAQVLFRDYLHRHNDSLNEYAALKQALAKQHRNDIIAYTDGKHEFIMNIVRSAIKERRTNPFESTAQGETAGIEDRIFQYHKAFIAEYDG